MAHSQKVSRPGGEQYLVVEHDGAEYEAKKERFQERVDGELVEREEYVLKDDAEDVPDAVVAEVDRANGAGDDEYCHLEAHNGGN